MKMENGMTMVELLITIVVVTILLALGVPSFQEFIKNNRVTAQTNAFVTAIQLARSEAIKRGTGAVICASNNQEDCVDGDWSNGWIIFSDINQDGNPDTGVLTDNPCEETEDCIISTSSGLEKVTLTSTENNIRFRPTGMTVNEAAVIFTMKSDDCKHEQARALRITKMGHMTVSHKPCP